VVKLKLSPRLLTIANMIGDDSKIIDIGCDHANLDIFLAFNRQNVYCVAADINEKIINNVKQKIKEYQLEDKIKAYQTDGLENIKIDDDSIIVISGLGTNTILKILTDSKNKLPKTLIIQSNNEIPKLRKEVTKLGYYIEDEKFVIDRHKDYVIIRFIRGYKKYNFTDYILGPILKENSLHVEKIINKYNEILTKCPAKYWFKRMKLKYLIYRIKKGYCGKNNR